MSEKCRSLINRLQGGDMKSYDYVKHYLLERLRLVKSYFVDKFNRVRQTNEHSSHMARLSSLPSYYVQSRNVHDFDELCQLLLCDRVKSVLPEGVLSHLLRYEATLYRM